MSEDTSKKKPLLFLNKVDEWLLSALMSELSERGIMNGGPEVFTYFMTKTILCTRLLWTDAWPPSSQKETSRSHNLRGP